MMREKSIEWEKKESIYKRYKKSSLMQRKRPLKSSHSILDSTKAKSNTETGRFSNVSTQHGHAMEMS
jgi:hypothetical protein